MFSPSLIKRIKVKNKKVEGVEIEKKKGIVSAKYVVSNADATQTFLTLIREEFLSKDMISKLKSLEPSLSMFILYFGIKIFK